MTVQQWQDGDILYAGSLRMIPQYYGQGTLDASLPSGTGYTTMGSVYVSGGLFGHSLLVNFFQVGRGGVNATSSTSQIFVSGAGLGGGSVIDTFSAGFDNDDTAVLNYMKEIPANAGWIPGSAAVVFIRSQSNQIVNGQGNGQLIVWGKGKP